MISQDEYVRATDVFLTQNLFLNASFDVGIIIFLLFTRALSHIVSMPPQRELVVLRVDKHVEQL